ncbi:MAG: dTMP kinase [Bdellovibrionaceae bacterium]|nr:dTMP kinase [Pseudobdellovibrionaceae bacterium]NUM56996.1 dTMP kinase [Pseudobdellovibrionaceae bacterium]
MAFIVFEGLDGSGKSTLMKALTAELTLKKISFVTTREPGGTPLGDKLRELIVTKADTAPLPRAELLLYEASRAQLVEQFIRPHLAKKNWVISDRFSASSIAFQCGGRALPSEQVKWLNDFATQLLEPDLYILLDVSVEESRRRRQSRAQQTGEAEDRIESEKDDFHQKVRHSFLEQAQHNPEHWLIVSAALKTEEMLKLVITKLTDKGWIK